MTLLRRLILFLLAVLVVVIANGLAEQWLELRRRDSQELLGEALRQQQLGATLQLGLHDLHGKLVDHLRSGAAGLSASDALDELDRFDGQIQVCRSAALLLDAADDSSETVLSDLRSDLERLLPGWSAVHEDVLRQGAKRADRLYDQNVGVADRLLQTRLPRLRALQRRRTEAALLQMERIGLMEQRTELLVLLASIGLVALAGLPLLRRLQHGLRPLLHGSAAIGGGDLHHRIELGAHDEFTQLGRAFNAMAHDTLLAQRQLSMANRELAKRNEEIEEQRRISESLLLNILPQPIARELQERGKVQPRRHDDVSILFTDFVGFTASTEGMEATELVRCLHDYFTAFDSIVHRYGLEKLKTIGDSYMCAGGLPQPHLSHPVDVVLAAIEMLQEVRQRAAVGRGAGWSIRIGIHCGPVMAGVVGIDKFAFDVWGRTVNFSSRVESAGSSNRINVSAAAHERIREFFDCEARGMILTKENREYEMFFVRGIRASLLSGGSSLDAPSIPPRFTALYRERFGAEPAAFPSLA